MYNSDFWEVRIDPNDLAQFLNEAGVWYQTPDDARYERRLKTRHTHVMPRLMELIRRDLTEKQFMILLLYFIHEKTQEEVAQIMGISRRTVSQHLFGICRDGKQVGRRHTQDSQAVPSPGYRTSVVPPKCIRWRVRSRTLCPMLIDRFNRRGITGIPSPCRKEVLMTAILWRCRV